MLKHPPPAGKGGGGSTSFRMRRRIPREAFLWTAGLIALALHDPDTRTHLALCPLYRAGFDFCPGCGLGRSISYLLHGDIALSLSTHPLGLFALIVLSYRIVQLLRHRTPVYRNMNNI